MDELQMKVAKRRLLKKVVTEVFRRRGMVLGYEDKRWLVKVAEQVWAEHLKTIRDAFDFEKFEGKYKRKKS